MIRRIIKKTRRFLAILPASGGIVAFFFLLSVHPIFSQEEARQELLEELVGDLSGDSREVAHSIKLLIEMKEYDLLAREVPFLFERNEPAITAEIFKGFLSMEMNLERYFPAWHLYVMEKVNVRSPVDHILPGIKLAGFWREHRLMPLLAKFAVHPSYEIRKESFRAMSRMQNDTIIPVLLGLLTSESPIERIYGLEGAVFYKDNRIMPFTLKLLDDPVRSVRVFAVLRLGSQESSDSISHLIVRNYRSDDDPEVREAVIYMIHRERWSRHGYLLHRAVLDPSAGVRREALKGVQALKESRAAPNISRSLLFEDIPELKILALNVLVSLGWSGGGDGIEYLLNNDIQEEVRLAAATAAGVLAERGLSDSLIKSMQVDPAASVRMEAAYALGRIGSSSALSDLEKVIRNTGETYEVRSSALASYLQIRGTGFSMETEGSMVDAALLAAMERTTNE